MAVVLALDVGGTKLGAAVVDDAGRILGRGRVPSPTGTDPEPLYEALVACAAAALRGADVLPGDLSGIGVAAAGPMVWPSGEVSPLNMPAWRGFPLRKRLAEEFASDRVLIHNDAVGLTVGEHWKGAGSGTANLLGMTVSTGVGGGLILDGHLNHGASGNAGHVGHVVVEPDGPACVCGGRGCLEAVASGPNTVRHALDDEGFTHVRVIVSGGFNAERIAAFEATEVPVDSYAVGSSLLTGGADYTADAVLREGRPCAKVGRVHRPSTRLQPVALADHRGAEAPV